MQQVVFSSRTELKRHTDMISGPWVEVDLDAIAHNYRQIQNICNVPLMPVIKGNAYGHGHIEVGRFLEKIGAHSLCVGYLREAVALREAGITCPILNLGPFSPKEAETIITQNISQSVFTDHVDHLDQTAGRLGKVARVHIKIDTGLGRVGVPYDSAQDYIRHVAGLSKIRIEGVFTTLTEDQSFDHEQLRRFNTIVESAADQSIDLGLRHAASSAAILEYPESHLDLVRPGITIFGHYPSTKEFRKRRIELKPALSLKARVSCVKILKKGDAVAYHRIYRAEEDQLMITGAIGYPDGYPSHIANKAQCIIRGRPYPLVATVTANNIYIQGNVDAEVAVGDEILLMGGGRNGPVSVESLAEISELSEYKLLAGLNPLLHRFYYSTQL
ncbi:MAG: alanine racemase [Deltaproteobacteria bacterium]|nr:alanine racemase [Deltaproteobacteria bacterium]